MSTTATVFARLLRREEEAGGFFQRLFIYGLTEEHELGEPWCHRLLKTTETRTECSFYSQTGPLIAR